MTSQDLSFVHEKLAIETPWLSWLVLSTNVICLIIQVIFIVTGVLLAIIGYFIYFPFAIGFPRNAIHYSLYAFILVVGAAENITMIVLWYVQPGNYSLWYHLPALVITCLTFFLGLVFMQIYNFAYRPKIISSL